MGGWEQGVSYNSDTRAFTIFLTDSQVRNRLASQFLTDGQYEEVEVTPYQVYFLLTARVKAGSMVALP
jgi:hypothetical protein